MLPTTEAGMCNLKAQAAVTCYGHHSVIKAEHRASIERDPGAVLRDEGLLKRIAEHCLTSKDAVSLCHFHF